MDALLQNEGVLVSLLARFTQRDANRCMRAVCRALHAACSWDHVPWVPCFDERHFERHFDEHGMLPLSDDARDALFDRMSDDELDAVFARMP
jgi:hypothetical protein